MINDEFYNRACSYRYSRRKINDKKLVEDLKIYEYNSIEKIIDFLKKIDYFSLNKSKKELISYWIKNYKDLDNFSFEEAIINKKDVRNEYLNNVDKSKWKIPDWEKRNNNSRLTRINKYKKDDISDEEALKISYMEGLKVKGIKNAELLNLNSDNLSDKELIGLSGLQKKNNYRNKSKKDQEIYILNWKRSCLSNKNIKEIVEGEVDISQYDLSKKEDIIFLYSIYCSYISSQNIVNNKCKNYGLSGHFVSDKTNNKMFYRSSLELKALTFCENIKQVKTFDTESIQIKYNDGEKLRRYIPDIILIYKEKEIIIEIKPTFKLEEWKEKYNKVIFSNPNIKIFTITEKQLETMEIFHESIKKFAE